MDYGVLARSYSTIDFPEKMVQTLDAFTGKKNNSKLSKFELHKKINQILFNNYHGEEILKYKLAQSFVNKPYVAAFEVKALNSRADFLVINGETKCFEIKSKIDTLARLGKQSNDYSDVFEFNTVVIDKKHLMHVDEILPNHYGIWFYDGNEKIIFREPSYSPKISPNSQLSILTKQELKKHFKSNSINEILKEFCPNTINQTFKTILKARYINRWKFIQDNWRDILPIDLQFFFNMNIKPNLLYSKD